MKKRALFLGCVLAVSALPFAFAAGCFYDVPPLAADAGVGADADASADRESGSDATSLQDVISVVDGPAAIQFTTGCASLSAQASLPLSFSNEDFTIAFWFRLDQPSAKNDVGIVWRGGRTVSQQGWSVGLRNGGLIFCTSDQSSVRCTTEWSAPLGHRLHIGATGKWGNQSPRTLALWVLDADGSKLHALVSTSSGVNNWTSAEPLVVGGASASNACDAFAPCTVDELPINKAVLTCAELDLVASNSSASCAGPGFLIGYRFDEGVGTSASACNVNPSLDLTGAYQWIPSPFP